MWYTLRCNYAWNLLDASTINNGQIEARTFFLELLKRPYPWLNPGIYLRGLAKKDTLNGFLDFCCNQPALLLYLSFALSNYLIVWNLIELKWGLFDLYELYHLWFQTYPRNIKSWIGVICIALVRKDFLCENLFAQPP